MVHLLLIIIYLAFISLGLPDSLLGSAWPVMYKEFGIPVSYAGILSMIIAAGTVLSSLQSEKLTKKFGTGKVTVASVFITAIALVGFSCSHSFQSLCLWAIPYGLGAGSVDASLNNYVVLNYASRHMSWLYCMWGLGASAGPYIMGYVLAFGNDWNKGYRYIGILQMGLSVILLLSLPLWKKTDEIGQVADCSICSQPLSLWHIVNIKGAKEVMVTFFCYSALEQTITLWVGSYLALGRGFETKSAAFYAGLFFAGITVGRALGGFLTIKLTDTTMVRSGIVLIFIGILFLFIPFSSITPLIGLILIGAGCAPVYPCIIHSIPKHFGTDKSQAMIGIQVASAYTGMCIMPPLFGMAANCISVLLFPFYLIIILLLMAFMHEVMLKKCQSK